MWLAMPFKIKFFFGGMCLCLFCYIYIFLRQVFQGSLHFDDLNIYVYEYHAFQLSTKTAKVWSLLYNYMLVTSKCRRQFNT